MNVPSVFLSHSSKDKPFVRELAAKLKQYNVKVWLDEAEINIGDSLVKKISVAVNDVDYLLVVLSEHSIKSKWVYEELEMAYSDQLSLGKIKILPILKDSIEIPSELKYLSGKRYADFTKQENFIHEFSILLRTLGIDTQSQQKDMITVCFFDVYKKRHWFTNTVKAQYILFNNEKLYFSNKEAAIKVKPGNHTFKYCIEVEQIEEEFTYIDDYESVEYKELFSAGSYYYACDIEQGRKFILIQKNKPVIQLLRHEVSVK